jgi:hypothetical protein
MSERGTATRSRADSRKVRVWQTPPEAGFDALPSGQWLTWLREKAECDL